MYRSRRYKRNSYNGYELISKMSFIVRCLFCYFTIETIDVFKNPLINYVVLEIFSLYTLLWAFSYLTNMVVIEKYNIRDSSVRSLIYFIIHIIYSVILYGVMSLLVLLKVLPM